MDGITPIALIATHALVFLALVWLMKKFAFGPILNLLDERKESVESAFAEAEKVQAEAKAMREEYKEDLQKAHAEARDLVKKTQADAEKLKESLQSETRAQVEKERKEATDRIAQETEAARGVLRKYVADLSILAAEKFLSDGLSDDQKKKLTDRTIPEIENAASRN